MEEEIAKKLQTEFDNFFCYQDESICELVRRYYHLFDEMRRHEIALTLPVLINRLADALTPEWNPFIMGLKASGELSQLHMNSFVARLKKEEPELKDRKKWSVKVQELLCHYAHSEPVTPNIIRRFQQIVADTCAERLKMECPEKVNLISKYSLLESGVSYCEGLSHELKDLKQLVDRLEKENIDLQVKCETYKQSLETIENMPEVPRVAPTCTSDDPVIVSIDDLSLEVEELRKYNAELERENIVLQDQCLSLKSIPHVKSEHHLKPEMVSVGSQVTISETNLHNASTSTPKTVIKQVTVSETKPKPRLYQSSMYSKPVSRKTSKTLEIPKSNDQGPPKSTKTPRKSTRKPKDLQVTQPKKSVSPGNKVYSSYKIKMNRPFLETTYGKNEKITGFRDQYGWFPHKHKKPSIGSRKTPHTKIDIVSKPKRNKFSKQVSTRKWITKADSSPCSTPSTKPIKYSFKELLKLKPRSVIDTRTSPPRVVDKRTCFQCGQLGHIVYNCPSLDRPYRSKDKSPTSRVRKNSPVKGQLHSERVQEVKPLISKPSNRAWKIVQLENKKPVQVSAASAADTTPPPGKWKEIIMPGKDGKPTATKAWVPYSN